MLRFPFRRRSVAAPSSGDKRIYAIGDIHGRLDLLNHLLADIKIDNAQRPVSETVVLLLGDMIDRGPDSAGVIDRAMLPLSWARLICLKGNHEATMDGALSGDFAAMEMWLRYGGIDALLSWGVSINAFENGWDYAQILEIALRAIPTRHREWVSQLPLSYSCGDYFFVHAGIRPHIAIDKQCSDDLLWIREPFLSSNANHGAVIVHGHSISDDVEQRVNRIGIDTGAYMSGRLTALAVEGTERWFLHS